MELVQFFMGVLYSPQTNLEELAQILKESFGTLESPSQVFSFHQTDYYTHEMGQNLSRIFFALEKLIHPSELPKLKKHSIQIENAFYKKNGKRSVNLDPGYLDSVKIILASTKKGGHKISLTKDIYADMVLDFYKGNFRFFEWSFPDFKSDIYWGYFLELRRNFLNKVKTSPPFFS